MYCDFSRALALLRRMEDGDAEASSLMRWLGFYAVDAREECITIVLRLLELAYDH